ncbi:glucose transporter GlcU [Bacillus sp. RO3]|nr:glucose transporter GlcU [Bacillus sp. RO3]
MGIFLALIPAVAWGSLVFVSVKLGGNAYSQTVGITIGALLFAIGAFFIKSPDMTLFVWGIGFISGIFWAVGQVNQLASVAFIGVAKTVPVSTGMQLIGTTLFGVLVFKEWNTTETILLGSGAVSALIIGVVLTSFTQKSEGGESSQLQKGLLTLLLSSCGYIAYVVILRWFAIDGWEAILPQAIGMFIGAVVITFRHKPFTKYTVRNILTGLMWASGNLGLLLALPRVGVATSFSLSQTGIVISTLGGLFFLGEKKSIKQVILVIAGCVLIILGGVLLGFTKE